MTTIKSDKGGYVREADLRDEVGQDVLIDIMGNSGCTVVDGNIVYVDTDDDVDWWADWARREQLIWQARDEADDEQVAADDRLIDELGYSMEDLQMAECKLFGIEY